MPGEILAELYLAPHGISIAAFAEACGITRRHMSGIVNGHVGITGAARRDARHHCAILAQFAERVDLYDAEKQLAESDTWPYLMPAFAAVASGEASWGDWRPLLIASPLFSPAPSTMNENFGRARTCL